MTETKQIKISKDTKSKLDEIRELWMQHNPLFNKPSYNDIIAALALRYKRTWEATPQ